MTTTSEVPTSHIDLSDPEFIRDPYPAWDEVREAGAVVFHEPLGQYMIARHAECAKTLGDATQFGQSLMYNDLFGGTTMITLDAPAHDDVRSIWRKDFLRPSIEAQRRVVASVVDSELLPFAERVRSGECLDAVTGMTRAIPTMVIAELLDVPAEDHEDFSNWSDDMVGIAEGFYDPSPRGAELVRRGEEARDRLNAYIQERVVSGDEKANGLLGRLVSSEVGKGLSIKDAVASVTQLVFAGNETTAMLMATTLFALAEYPEQRDLLLEDRSLIPQALEEILRWSSVAPVSWRVVRERGAQVGETRLPAGAVVNCLQGAANRDPRRWERPHDLDFGRPVRSHVGFGFGMHSCLGLSLARLESQIWLNRLLDVLPDWEVGTVDWGLAWVARGPHRIDISS